MQQPHDDFTDDHARRVPLSGGRGQGAFAPSRGIEVQRRDSDPAGWSSDGWPHALEQQISYLDHQYRNRPHTAPDVPHFRVGSPATGDHTAFSTNRPSSQPHQEAHHRRENPVQLPSSYPSQYPDALPSSSYSQMASMADFGGEGGPRPRSGRLPTPYLPVPSTSYLPPQQNVAYSGFSHQYVPSNLLPPPPRSSFRPSLAPVQQRHNPESNPYPIRSSSFPSRSYPLPASSWAAHPNPTIAYPTPLLQSQRSFSTNPPHPHESHIYVVPDMPKPPDRTFTANSDTSRASFATRDSTASPPSRSGSLSVPDPRPPPFPTTPFQSSLVVSPIVNLVAAYRTRRNSAPTSSPRIAPPRLNTRFDPTDDVADRRRTGKPKIDCECRCSTCGVEIAKLIFRGDASAPHRLEYACMACAPLAEIVVDPGAGPEAPYGDSLFAAVDRLLGVPVEERDLRPPPRKERMMPQQRKRKAEDETVFCDVCARAVGSGRVYASDGRGEVPFGVEVICISCDDRYRRCTDCGGGGGPRIGIGKWRSKELFPEGRRTCSLSHLRLSTLPDMSYDIWPIEDLPPEQIDEFVSSATQVHASQMYATLGTPDILESEIAMATTFAEVEKLTFDFWAVIEPMLRGTVVENPEIPLLRYLALRWAIPTRRKTKSVEPELDCTRSEDVEDLPTMPLVRRGKNLAGFIVAELDLLSGSLLLVLQTPWATGDNFDATTILFQDLLQKATRDVDALNVERVVAGEKKYPPIGKAWLLTYFRQDCKLTTHVINRRGFLHLEDYLTKYPETDAAVFSRPVFFPPEYLDGWHILVRKLEPDDNWSARSSPKKTKTKRGKDKED